MAETTYWGTTGDGYLYAEYTTDYTVARDAATADAISTGSVAGGIGWFPSSKRLYRSYLSFDTTAVTGPVTDASIRLYLDNEWYSPAQGHEIVLMHNADHPGDVLDTGDFKRQYYESGGAANVKVFTGDAGSNKTFTLNSTGRGWINKGGITSLCMRSVYDVSLSPPTYIWAGFNTANRGGEYRPKLVVDIGGAPEVTTSGSSSVTINSAIVNGIVDDAGSSGITEYGFIYNNDYSDPANFDNADNKKTASNMTGATGAFSATLSSLSSATKHQYRAYATNAVVSSFGLTGNFTTLAPLSVTTREPSLVGGTTATLNGNIIGDGADDITDHGFIYKASSDPYEEASPISNPTGAAHCVQLGTGSIGAYSYGLTGATGSTPYLVRSYAQTTGGTAYGKLRVMRTGIETETTFDGETGDGYAQVYKTGAVGSTVLAAALNASTADSVVTNTIIYATVLYTYSSNTYRVTVRRGYVYFDTSAIPAGATIISATLKLYITVTEADFYPFNKKAGTLYVSANMPTYPHDPLAVGDYGDTNFTDIATLARASITSGAYNEITIPAANVTAGGTSKYRLNQDNNAGSAYTIVGYYIASGEDATNPPQLVVTYSATPNYPPLPQINAGGTMRTSEEALIYTQNQWRLVTEAQINAGGTMRDLTGA